MAERKNARSRAVTFIANEEVLDFLNSLESGIKSKVINRALKHYMDRVDPDDVFEIKEETGPLNLNAYQSSIRDEFEIFADWLYERENRQNRKYSLVGTSEDDKPVRLSFLLKKFTQRDKKKSRNTELLVDEEE